METATFTSLVDLASKRLGGSALAASDEFFAPRENLLEPGRGLFIAVQAPDTYSRLLAGSISLTFLVYVFVNTAMVTGLVPVVGVPLPLVSFGGTSMVTLMAGFGILMSIHSHRKLLPH